MTSIRRQQIAEQGHKLAEWLNDPKWEKNEVRLRIAFAVSVADWVRRLDADDERAGRIVSTADWKHRLGIGIAVVTRDLRRRLDAAGKPMGRIVNSEWLDLRMRGRFVPRGQGIDFELEPHDGESRWLYVWGVLHNTGNASRVRSCPNCKKFWYCDGRTDKRACSKACKDALWEKTPEGRAAKAAWMRDHRKKEREEEEKQGQRLTGKRRKASKSILSTLGK